MYQATTQCINVTVLCSTATCVRKEQEREEFRKANEVGQKYKYRILRSIFVALSLVKAYCGGIYRILLR